MNGGNTGAPGLVISVIPLNECAAAPIISSVKRLASDANTPSPNPGYIRALLAWPIMYSTPLYITLSEGIPVATNALPSDQTIKSSADASANLVGFDNGNIHGRSVFWHIASTISLVKVFGCVEVPTRIVGLTVLTTSNKSVNLSAFGKLARFLANGFCSGVKSSISSKRSPCLSTIKKRSYASSSDNPWLTISRSTRDAIPAPAVPPP